MSELLRAFYVTYHEWLNQEAKDKQPFNRGNGLCANLGEFCKFMELNDDTHDEIFYEMEEQFNTAGLSKVYPFNSTVSYVNECLDLKCHTNPKRIAWVKEKLGV